MFTFAMSLMMFAVLNISAKTSEKSVMARQNEVKNPKAA